MPKQVAKLEVNTFVGGFITEASPLNFPPNASSDEENFDFKPNGLRSRRKGIDWESEHALISAAVSPSLLGNFAYNTYKWTSPGGDNTKEILVVQIGKRLDFFLLNEERLSSQGFLQSLTLPLSSNNTKCSFASIEGMLAIACGEEEIYSVEYSEGVFSLNSFRLQVRDLWGVFTNEAANKSFRPKTPSEYHIYNLRNQGWALPRRCYGYTMTYELIPKTGPEVGEVLPEGIPYGNKFDNINLTYWAGAIEDNDPIASLYSMKRVFPSNSDTVWSGMQTVGQQLPLEEFYPDQLFAATSVGGVSAKGYFIIDALRRGASRLEAINLHKVRYPDTEFTVSSLPQDQSTGGASVVEAWAGRVFYAGFSGEVVGGDNSSPDLTNAILFSQVVKGKGDINKCYQDGDPTSREDSDIVDTDGGFIKISNAGPIIQMANLGSALAVVATNGVWVIKGGSDYGFSATNYSVEKVSSSGCQTPFSIVEVEGAVFFWGDSGIIRIARNEFGDLVATNVTEATIQTFYDEIPLTEKRLVSGFYNETEKKIIWLYGQKSEIGTGSVTELRFDLRLNAFSKYKLNNSSTSILANIPPASFRSGIKEDTVVIGGDVVEVNTLPVDVVTTQTLADIPTAKYLVLVEGFSAPELLEPDILQYSFAELNNEDFMDWGVVDAKAYLVTGAFTAGETGVAKQIPYLIMHFVRTEEGVDETGVPLKQSGCKVRSQWDWAVSVVSKKWSEFFQAYRYKRPLFSEEGFDNGFETIVSKSKLRGRGKAISLHIETEEAKDCKIIGWCLQVTGNQL